MFKKSVFLLLAAGVLLAAWFGSQVYTQMHSNLGISEPQSINFMRGSTIRTLAKQLKERGLLANEKYFLVWGRLSGQSTRLQAGEYRLTPQSTLASLLDDMVNGKVVQHNITLIEGQTFRQVLQAIQKHPAVTALLLDENGKPLDNDAIMARLGHPGEHPEGRFYPDTYAITHGISDIELLQRAYNTMAQILAEEWAQREKDLPFETPYEALIMASIVEKESAVAEERPLIAGVFINRLRKNMRLQTDPTVIYGIPNYDGNIRFRDLRRDTPYNTYTRHGLPPTPIALPGREAIHATLHPDETPYLYFVAYGDGSGRHYFSKTLKEHEKAVDKYQRRKKR